MDKIFVFGHHNGARLTGLSKDFYITSTVQADVSQRESFQVPGLTLNPLRKRRRPLRIQPYLHPMRKG
jgi:hypothetical protein